MGSALRPTRTPSARSAPLCCWSEDRDLKPRMICEVPSPQDHPAYLLDNPLRDRATWSLAAAIIASVVKPNFRCNSLRGAEAPKVFMPMVWPLAPTYSLHPSVEACSTDTRAVTDAGSTSSRYSGCWRQ